MLAPQRTRVAHSDFSSAETTPNAFQDVRFAIRYMTAGTTRTSEAVRRRSCRRRRLAVWGRTFCATTGAASIIRAFATAKTIAVTTRMNATAIVIRIHGLMNGLMNAEMGAAFSIINTATDMPTAIMTKTTVVSVHPLAQRDRYFLIFRVVSRLSPRSRDHYYHCCDL